MAYITQFEVDKKQDAATSNMANGIADIGAILGQNRRRALDEKRAQFKQGMEFASMGITPDTNEQKELQESGYSQSLLEKYAPVADEARKTKLGVEAAKTKKAVYEAGQLDVPIEERDDTKKAVIVGREREKIYANRMGNQEQNKIEAEQRALDNKKKDAVQKVAISDYDIADPEVIPTQKDAEEVKKLSASNKSFQGLGQSVAEKLGKADPRNPAYYVGNDWKLLQQDLTKMKLQAKNLEDLGVLNGPDLSLVNETLGAITPATLAILGKDKAAERIQAALGNSQKVLENAASSRGYKPKSKLAPEDDAAINWAKANANDPRAQQILQLHGAK